MLMYPFTIYCKTTSLFQNLPVSTFHFILKNCEILKYFKINCQEFLNYCTHHFHCVIGISSSYVPLITLVSMNFVFSSILFFVLNLQMQTHTQTPEICNFPIRPVFQLYHKMFSNKS